VPFNRFAGQAAGVLTAIKGALKSADQAVGGWVPGGGVASPVTRAAQSVTPSRNEVLSAVRDKAVVPVIDKGIETGLLPAKQAMFARYLSGTSKPLMVYPEKLKQGIRSAFDQIAVEETKEQVDDIFKANDPAYRKYMNAREQFRELQSSVRDRAEMQGIPSSDSEVARLKTLEQTLKQLSPPAGIAYGSPQGDEPRLSNQQRLELIAKHGLFNPNQTNVSFNSAYGGSMPTDVELTLGQFAIQGGEVRDRYKFDGLEHGRQELPSWGRVYPDAAGGGQLASDLIEMGLKAGTITPKSGYDIRVPLNRK
jgi:hypothetical protein